jgi:hypothetical protein
MKNVKLIREDMPLSDKYQVKTNKAISNKEMSTKIRNGVESKFNKALKEFNTNWSIPKKKYKRL